MNNTIEYDMRVILNYVSRMNSVCPSLLQEAINITNKLDAIDGSNPANTGNIRYQIKEYRKKVDKKFEIATSDKESFVISMASINDKHDKRAINLYPVVSYHDRFSKYSEKFQREIDRVKIKQEICERSNQQVKAFGYQKILISLVREKNTVDGIATRLNQLIPKNN